MPFMAALPLSDVLAPAIAFAEKRLCDFAAHTFRLGEGRGASGSRRTCRPHPADHGRTPRVGEMHRQPELAATLRRIAAEGRDGFYRGPVAEDMVNRLRELGGLHTLDDFAAAKGEYVTPVTTNFRGHTIHECPPNGQGIIALMILNILSHFEAKGAPDDVDRIHIELEATRLAYAARDSWLADPAKADVPVEEMLSDEMARRLAGMIDLKRAIADLPPFELPLTAIRSISRWSIPSGTPSASSTRSYYTFGSCIVAPKSGVVMHNRGQSFSLTRGHPT